MNSCNFANIKPYIMESEEKQYQLEYCNRYFGAGNWAQELHKVDVILKGKKGKVLLYIEFKYILSSESEIRTARAQTILTNKKQEQILDRVALAYRDTQGNDILELFDCSDDSVMYNNDINWKAEKPSSPSPDAVARINDRLKDKITPYRNDDIKQLYQSLRQGSGTEIQITDRNFSVVYNQWKNAVRFKREVLNEQELINLFLTDILNGTHYQQKVKKEVTVNTLFGPVKVGEQVVGTGKPLFRENTNLSKYELERTESKIRIVYAERDMYSVVDTEAYDAFWRTYKRPPEQGEFMKILEHSARLYSENYRRDTGGEYTPTCFVELQNELLTKYGYNLNDYIVCDPCAGVGNLENQFGKDYKRYCYLSTLEQMDVDICKIKGFENTICYDYLKNDKQPAWKFQGEHLDIREITKREGRKLMIVMNPPYTRQKGFKNNLAIEFFNKILLLEPDVIIFYYETSSFLNNEIDNYIRSGYKIVSHVISNAKTTFKLSEWPISQVIFDKKRGVDIKKNNIVVERFELDKYDNFVKKGTYTYDIDRPNLFKQLQQSIKNIQTGAVLGNVSYLNDVIKIGNGGTNRGNHVTIDNLKLCLLSKGLIFNTHHKYFELNSVVHRGTINEIPHELFCDAVMFSLFYKGFLFTNKGKKNYIMPFTAEELGCERNDLNVLYDETQATLFDQGNNRPFDFREFLFQFDFSAEAKALYKAALQVFLFYHHSPVYQDKDWNDSFYDITNAIMHKDITTFKSLDSATDRRISRTKTTKGTKGFGRNNIRGFVPEDSLPIVYDFFDKRDILAKKINRELLDAHLLLWERENIY